MALHPQALFTEGQAYFLLFQTVPGRLRAPRQIVFIKCYHLRVSRLQVVPGVVGSMQRGRCFFRCF